MPPGSFTTRTILLAVASCALGGGCSTHNYLVRRTTPANPLAMELRLDSLQGPDVSPRTARMLRRFALHGQYDSDPAQCLESMQTLLESEVDSELVYGISELAYILGRQAEKRGREATALDMYGVAVSNAYMYLFSAELDKIRNPYDPQFRGACDLYNESLEATLRLIIARDELVPGESYELTTGEQTYEVHTLVRGNWEEDDFAGFEFVSDYDVEGLPASGLTYGLGVPLIAIRREGDPQDPREGYYPEGLSFPVTALLRVVRPGSMPGKGADHRHHCILELHDPLAASDLSLAGRLVPLQTDLSTSLAYFLDSPQFRETNRATLGLLNPQKTQQHRGIYMLEPYDPTKIPVLMVHGLWSSPVTWMPMFNDLRSFRELRKNYQFWFYQYPTGQPFWLSATQLRQELQQLRNQLDPERRYQALDHMVLVGHSMGGLVSRLQTIESRNDFWRILSDEPFENVQGDSETLTKLRRAAFFRPNPSVRRIVTIGTPHRGSDFANDATRWLGRTFITLPSMMVSMGTQLINQNPGVFRNTDLLTSSTSIDSLSPDSPVFDAMLRAPRNPNVTYHNIIGMIPTRNLFGLAKPKGDGVVEIESAHMDDVASEIVVESEHQNIHRAPEAILEVRRILREHLEAVRREYRVAERARVLEVAGLAAEPATVRPANAQRATPGTLPEPIRGVTTSSTTGEPVQPAMEGLSGIR